YAAAVDVGQAVQRLIPEASHPAGPGTSPRVAIGVDPRTNSLLVRADNPIAAKRIRELAESMDIPTAAGGNIHVVYHKPARADRRAEALRASVPGQPIARPAAASALSPNQPPGGLGAPGAPPPPPPPAALPAALGPGAGGAGGAGGA